jgi:SAM-dependent methyltransferase
METATYGVEAGVESSHWWFAGRRRLVAALMRRHGVGPEARVLDVGTSTGTNLRMLGELGFRSFEGLEASEEAIRLCAEKGLGKVTRGDICAMPFGDATFDLVLATDVIEHVDDDVQALREVRRVLKPGGVAIVTVPAFRLLWGLQDEVAHHKRRYRAAEVRERVRAAGLRCRESFYFNYLLFLPILAARQVIRLLGLRLESENEVNGPFVNAVLSRVFAFDVATAPRLHPPFGVSFLALVERQEDRA